MQDNSLPPVSLAPRGLPGPPPWLPPVPWVAGVPYLVGPPASFVTYAGGSYVCLVPHTSAATFDPSLWALVNDPGNAQTATAASASAVSAANAANAAFNGFLSRYLGGFADDASAAAFAASKSVSLVAGTTYLNLTEGKLRLYSGTKWGDDDASAQAAATAAASSATATQTLLSAIEVAAAVTGAPGSPASLNVSGSPPTFTFTIPQGAAGVAGPIGAPGPTGSPGPGLFLNEDNFLEVVFSSDGFPLYGVDRTGRFLVNSLGIGASGAAPLTGMTGPSTDNFAEMTIDTSGNFIGGWERNLGPVGPFTPLALSARIYAGAAASNLLLLNDPKVIYFFPVWGQSLSCGLNQLTESPISLTAVDPGNALMFSPGPWPNGQPVGAAFADLHEVAYNGAKQSICSSFALALNTRLNAALGEKAKILMAIAGLTSQPYRTIKKSGSSGVYAELLRLVRAARDIANSTGFRLVVPAVLVLHGEQDQGGEGTRRHQYLNFMEQFRLDLEDDIFAINPQTMPLRLLTYTTEPVPATVPGFFPEISMAQLDMHQRRARIRNVGPLYWLDRGAADGVHPNAAGYYKLGETFAESAAHEIFGLPNAGPCHVIESWQSSATTFDVRFSVPVLLDTSSTIVDTTTLNNLGFDFTDLSGASPAISGVAAVSGFADIIRITLASAPGGPRKRLFLGCRANSAFRGPLTGARTAVRAATAFATSTLDGTTPLYHWAIPTVLEF